MNKTFLVSALVSFLTILTLTLPGSAHAVINAYNLVNETNKTYTTRTGTYTDITTTGYGGHAYQSMSRAAGGPVDTMKWKCSTSTPTNYYYHVWVAVPLNYGVYDGTYKYRVTNTAETFPINLNQEAFANQWVYLGFANGTGGPDNCFVTVANIDLSSSNPREFWVDHIEYYPSSSVRAPQGTYGW